MSRLNALNIITLTRQESISFPRYSMSVSGGVWTPLNLASIAAWYDPSDLSTMWQDSAKTTPVTASGQPIGYILDKSGFNRHLSQTNNAIRPTLSQDGGGRYYISLSSAVGTLLVDNGTASGIHQGQSLFFAGAAAQAVTAGTGGVLLGLVSPTVEYGYSVEGLRVGWTSLGRRLNTDAYNAIAVGTDDFTLQSVIGVYDYANAFAYVYKNNLSVASGTFETPGLSDTTGTATIGIGGIAGYGAYFNGPLYQLVLGNSLSSADRTNLDAFLRSKAGI